MITNGDALQSLRPGAQWTWRGSDYSGLEWLDAVQTKPTEQEIADEVTRLEAAQSAETARLASFSADAGVADLLDRARTASVAQIDTWLTNNVTNLAQARAVLAAIIKFIVSKRLF